MPPNFKRVFIVDDSPIVRERLAHLVRDLPNVSVVGEADHALQAIHDIQRLLPDLVILDISMPGGSGMHVLETVKRHCPAVQVIMLTNFAYEQYRDKCRQLGADYFFDKSTEIERMLEVIEKLASPSGALPPLADSPSSIVA